MPPEHAQTCFIQLGATRDGLDPYLDAARQRGLHAVLVETPAYLMWRRQLGRRSFDVELEVQHPADPLAVQKALEDANYSASLILPGFERYVESAYALAQQLHVRPWRPHTAMHFQPPDKWDQRQRLARHAHSVAQPNYTLVPKAGLGDELLESMTPPLVIKPTNGGGGLGVFLARDRAAFAAALTLIGNLSNYDGSAFPRIMAEEYIPGTEVSLQGVARYGQTTILTVCEKFISQEPVPGCTGVLGFREAGHVASPGKYADPALLTLAQRCAETFAWRDGPFHIDAVHHDDRWFFLEMGFRLSGGGLVRLVRLATGLDWGELSFSHYLGEQQEPPTPNTHIVGQIAAVNDKELREAKRLAAMGYDIFVEELVSPPDSLGTQVEPLLASDRMRHTGLTGRITARAASALATKELLWRCAPDRLTQPVQEGAPSVCVE